MTTTPRPACLMDVCQKCRKPENWRETAFVHGDTEPSTYYRHRKDGWPTLQSFQHEFVGHTHSVECSARFWREFRGCVDAYERGGDLWCDCFDSEEGIYDHGKSDGQLADIIASPGTDEARLAMFDVLEEYEERDTLWQVRFIGYFIQTFDLHDEIKNSVWDLPAVLMRFLRYLTPDHVALAAWAASLDEGS